MKPDIFVSYDIWMFNVRRRSRRKRREEEDEKEDEEEENALGKKRMLIHICEWYDSNMMVESS